LSFPLFLREPVTGSSLVGGAAPHTAKAPDAAAADHLDRPLSAVAAPAIMAADHRRNPTGNSTLNAISSRRAITEGRPFPDYNRQFRTA